MIIIEVYVDDIIFGSDHDRLSQQFSKDIQSEFEMSLLGELNFFLGLQISQLDDGIFISQSKYIKETLKKFGNGILQSSKHTNDYKLQVEQRW